MAYPTSRPTIFFIIVIAHLLTRIHFDLHKSTGVLNLCLARAFVYKVKMMKRV